MRLPPSQGASDVRSPALPRAQVQRCLPTLLQLGGAGHAVGQLGAYPLYLAADLVSGPYRALPALLVATCRCERGGQAAASAAVPEPPTHSCAGPPAPPARASPCLQAVFDRSGREFRVMLRTWQNVMGGPRNPTFVLEKTGAFQAANNLRQGDSFGIAAAGSRLCLVSGIAVKSCGRPAGDAASCRALGHARGAPAASACWQPGRPSSEERGRRTGGCRHISFSTTLLCAEDYLELDTLDEAGGCKRPRREQQLGRQRRRLAHEAGSWSQQGSDSDAVRGALPAAGCGLPPMFLPARAASQSRFLWASGGL